MGRPRTFKEYTVASIRFELAEYQQVQDIAELESLNTGRKISTHALIRDAVRYVYADNQRLREIFKRTRQGPARRYK